MLETLKTFIRFPFKGPEWPSRFLIGSALVLGSFVVPIIPSIFVLGYVIRIMKKVIQGEDPSLPAWDNFNELIANGVKGFIVSLIYLLPGFIFIVGGYILYFLSLFVSSSPSEGGTFAPLVGLFLLMAGLLLGIVLLTLGSIPLPAAIANLAARGNIGAAFEVSEWWALIKANPWGYLGAWAISVGIGYIGYWISFLPYYTIVLCCFVPLLLAPVIFYVLVVAGAVFGQFYRESSFSIKEME
ncbi:MAG: DUF4013 domain-containing protein [Anaerolineae bacterium]|nr:DUF4013 domain-containing protein [Anaerolineae bacterium]MDW8102862.1 DUF4013 domain-containing protein [Anaerolineae bacterium]